MRRFVLIFILSGLLVSAAYASGTLEVDGKKLTASGPVFVYHKIEYVDGPAIFKALGFETLWNEAGGKLVFKSESVSGVLSVHSRYAALGASMERMAGPLVFLDGRLCVPRAFFDSALSGAMKKKIAFVNVKTQPAPDPIGLPNRPLYLQRVVIDAGHGGHDSGARSPEGLKEKDIVLAVAKQLGTRLNHEMGIETVLTRADDRFITLGERARIANTSEADLFISIHANGAFNSTATGTETYFLSYEASDKKAARIAADENKSLMLEAENPLKDSDPDDLKRILWDMVQTENLKESEKLASTVQEKLQSQMHLPSRGVKQAPFYVLMGSSIPAILVEIGFMTTSAEANQLADPRIQERITDALFHAILHYDTIMAIKSGGQ